MLAFERMRLYHCVEGTHTEALTKISTITFEHPEILRYVRRAQLSDIQVTAPLAFLEDTPEPVLKSMQELSQATIRYLVAGMANVVDVSLDTALVNYTFFSALPQPSRITNLILSSNSALTLDISQFPHLNHFTASMPTQLNLTYIPRDASAVKVESHRHKLSSFTCHYPCERQAEFRRFLATISPTKVELSLRRNAVEPFIDSLAGCGVEQLIVGCDFNRYQHSNDLSVAPFLVLTQLTHLDLDLPSTTFSEAFFSSLLFSIPIEVLKLRRIAFYDLFDLVSAIEQSNSLIQITFEAYVTTRNIETLVEETRRLQEVELAGRTKGLSVTTNAENLQSVIEEWIAIYEEQEHSDDEEEEERESEEEEGSEGSQLEDEEGEEDR